MGGNEGHEEEGCHEACHEGSCTSGSTSQCDESHEEEGSHEACHEGSSASQGNEGHEEEGSHEACHEGCCTSSTKESHEGNDVRLTSRACLGCGDVHAFECRCFDSIGCVEQH